MQKIELKWGIIIPTMLFILLIIEYLSGLHKYENIHLNVKIDTIMGILIPIIGYTLALLEYRKSKNGIMPWGNGIMMGLMISIIAAPVAMGLVYSFLTWINPNYFETMIKYSLDNGFHSSEKLASQYFSTRSYMIQTILGNFVGGIIISTIISFFLKTKTSK